MSSDEKTIMETAKTWIENGGDAEGILWSINKLYVKVKELENA
jgi:hypothetical protein